MISPAHILLVEDNDADAELVAETLEEERVRIELTRARDGVEALEMLRPDTADSAPLLPDLILLDLNLPRMDGRELLGELKADATLRRIPVVVLTSSSAPSDIERSYDLQAACYVTKPLDLDGFSTIVRAIEGFWLTVVRFPPNDRH